MASIISELRSVTFQSQSTTTVFVSELNIQKHNIMAPQQQDTLPKSSDFEVEHPQKASPVSNLGTSVESCSPVSNGDAAVAMKSNKDEKMEDSSSDDSGSVQNYHVLESEYPSPLMRLQSALRKDGKLGKKLNLSSPSPQTHATNNWLSTANGVLERNLPTSSSVTTDKTATTAIHSNNSLSTTNDIYPSNLTSTGMYTNMTATQSANCKNNVQSMSDGLCHNRPSLLPPRSYHDCLPHNTPGQFNESNMLSCRVCDFTSMSQEDLDSHMDNHYTYTCEICPYRSKTEGRLTRHLTEFHSEIPPDNWTGTRASKAKGNNSEQLLDNSVSSSNNKTRAFRCKHCTFVAYTKSDFWRHVRTHIKPDKLLECEQCEFVTEFKHHYEYHISNHEGRKPFKCSMCNYKCVNKSMLNSHLKSHSNVYQFHCADCKYETKYCHSIKQHLKKHNHKPGVVLNQDGTPCPFQVIDVYGRRRGPRTKKRKLEMSDENCLTSSVPSATQLHTVPPTSQPSLPFSTSVPMLQPNIPTVYPHFFRDYTQMMVRNSPHMRNSSFPLPMPVTGRNPICCTMCHFIAPDSDTLKRHMLMHIAAENQDLAKLYGINSEFFNDQQLSLSSDINGQKNWTEPEDSDKKFIPSEYERKLEFHEGARSYKQEHDVDETIKCEDRDSSKCRIASSPAVEENDSYKGYSTPSPQYSSSHSPDFTLYEKRDEANQRTSPTMLRENRMHVDESPIDLSGRKSSDSVYTSKVTGALDTQNSELNTPALTSTTEPPNMSSSSQRNRRKGKAYRINYYEQYDEQSSHQEFAKGSDKHNPLVISTTKDEVKQSEKEQNLVRVPTTSPDKQLNIEVHTITEVDDSLRQKSKSKSNSPADRLASSPVAIKGNCLSSSNTQPVRIESSNDRTSSEPTMKSEKTNSKNVKTDSFVRQDIYECNHCGIEFKNSAMYSVHKGYHGYKNPFTCNLCGHVTDNAIDFFVHIARVSHP